MWFLSGAQLCRRPLATAMDGGSAGNAGAFFRPGDLSSMAFDIFIDLMHLASNTPVHETYSRFDLRRPQGASYVLFGFLYTD